MPIVLGRKGSGGGGSAAPSGPAGGDLAGTYPNPAINAQSSADGSVLTSDGANATAFELPPGYEYAYAQITTNSTSTATTEAAAGTIVTAPAFTADGTSSVIVAFFAAAVEAPLDLGVNISLYLDGSAIGLLTASSVTGSGADTDLIGLPVFGQRRLTPAAGSRTYSARLWGGTGTKTVYAGAGGAGANMPAFIRVTKV